MSLAGPYGEAACVRCGTLQDLDYRGRLERHYPPKSVRPNLDSYIPQAPPPRVHCQGSRLRPEPAPQELSSLAFHSEPVMEECWSCGARVEVWAAGRERERWQFQGHETKNRRGETVECPGSGEYVIQPVDLVKGLPG